MTKNATNLQQKVDETTNKTNDLLKARKGTLKNAAETANEPSFEWLTDHSRHFLASGYLSEGISAEERIREIANRAEDILGIPGFADKFYHYMGEGFYSLASPVWSNFGKKRGLLNSKLEA